MIYTPAKPLVAMAVAVIKLVARSGLVTLPEFYATEHKFYIVRHKCKFMFNDLSGLNGFYGNTKPITINLSMAALLGTSECQECNASHQHGPSFWFWNRRNFER